MVSFKEQLHEQVANASDAWAFGWEALAALGTFLAVAASLWIAERARSAAERGLAQQLTEFADARRREHEIDILVRLIECISQFRSNGGEASGTARFTAQGLIASLDDQSDLPWSLYVVEPRVGHPFPPDGTFSDRDSLPNQRAKAVEEIGRRISRVARAEVSAGA